MIYLASDHGGYTVKEKVKSILMEQGLQWHDAGPKSVDKDDDYPDYVIPMAEKVSKDDATGIISCRNGQGAAIAANKVQGIRAAVCWNEECVRTARNDDNANILSIPADYLTDLEIEKLVAAWLDTPYSHDARHSRRIQKIYEYETEKADI